MTFTLEQAEALREYVAAREQESAASKRVQEVLGALRPGMVQLGKCPQCGRTDAAKFALWRWEDRVDGTRKTRCITGNIPVVDCPDCGAQA